MIENILEVKIDNEVFGIDADIIAHILKIPPITPLSVVDEAIKGISVILGKIVTIIDTAVLLQLNQCDISNDKARILTISDDTAIIVDEVLDIINVDEKNYEESEDDIIAGFYKDNDKIIQILNIDNLFNNITPKEFEVKKINIISQKEQKEELKDIDTIRTLFFRLGDEKFCLDISIVQEIIFVPEITPNTNPMELGLITLRDEVIPIIDMKKLFGFKNDVLGKAIIIRSDNGLLAFVVDEIEEVKDIDISQIEKIEDEKIDGIFKGDELASIISSEYIKNLVNKHNVNDSIEENIKGDSNMIEIVVFNIDEEEFAFDIESVQEIIKYQKATFFPQAPSFVEGLLNLRGSVIPIISLPKKLGFNENITDKTKIIVCSVSNEKIGFIVDEVNDIMFIEDEYISKVENEDSIFDEIINLDERVVFKININKLFSDEEIDAIKLTKTKNG